jgi:putative transposase
MCSFLRNRYRVESARLKGYDYSSNGKYFITICTKNKIKHFGEIQTGKILLNKSGEIAKRFWMDIPNHFQFAILDEFIVMPNHLHGIIIINHTDVETPNLGVSMEISEQQLLQPIKQRANWNSNSIGMIINQYKRICTIKIKELNPSFSWQSRYHNHIIHTKTEFNLIRNYIR